MKQLLVSLHCPKCGWEGYHLSQQVIIPDLEPDLRRAMLDDSYFKAPCMHCGQMINFFHECLYQDKAHGFVLWFKHHDKVTNSEHLYQGEKLKKRYMLHGMKTSEKIKMFEDGFDDKTMNLLKSKLKKTNIQYYDYQQSLIWFTSDEGLFAIDDKYYNQLVIEDSDEDFILVE